MISSSVVIWGAKTLDRYTHDILVKGFQGISWKSTVASPAGNPSPTEANLFQLHGAPQSQEDDKQLMIRLEELLLSSPETRSLRLAVLIHRPDELQLLYPTFRKILEKSQERHLLRFHLVLLGDKHLNDEFYHVSGSLIQRHIIPHCFFDLKPRFLTGAIAVGTFTTWGEMRSVQNVLKLILSLFRQQRKLEPATSRPHRVVGYLGGRPAADLATATLTGLVSAIDSTLPIEIIAAKTFDESALPNRPSDSPDLILVDAEGSESLTPHFNTQLYHLGQRVRTGESSGSVHSSAGIPVILEMNGSETIENLHVVKIPYGSVERIDSVDFDAGAASILSVIRDGSFKTMLEHNLEQSKKFNCTYSAQRFAELLTSS